MDDVSCCRYDSGDNRPPFPVFKGGGGGSVSINAIGLVRGEWGVRGKMGGCNSHSPFFPLE